MTRALDSPALPSAPARGIRARVRGAVGRIGRSLGLTGDASLARRFLIASLIVLLVGGVTIGLWVGSQLQRGIIDRTASITALYVQSFIEPHLASMANGKWLSDEDKGQLDSLVANTTFGEKVVALKVWRPDGVIIYSPDRELIGEQFPVDEDLSAALAGNVTADMSTLGQTENINERARGFDHLLEMYLPVRERGSDRIIAVAEFYQLPNEIDQEVAGAQMRSWLVVTGAVALAYLLLFGIVRRGNDTIVRQQSALQTQVNELSTLLNQNEQLRDRVRTAAERTTTLSERNLRRISSDLHDGPGQMMALAMLRLERLQAQPTEQAEYDELRSALTDALRDMRSIAAGLRLPELEALSTADTVRRVVDDHVRRSGTNVELAMDEGLGEASLPTKIALFRALQELLSNSTRHGDGSDVRVRVTGTATRLRVAVSDNGPGFDGASVGAEGHLGLAGIREQAELLGGSFDVAPGENGGVTVTVSWPLR
jgi:signal transduction histidine kinase